MRYGRLFPLFLTLLVLHSVYARSIEEHLQDLEGVTPTLLQRLESTEQPLEGIPPQILKEAGLISYTRWNLGWEGRTFRLAVLEMLDSQAAFGLFTRTQGEIPDGKRLQLGVDSLLSDGKLYFWKGHFWIKLELPAEASEAGAGELAHLLIGVIDEPNLYPMPVVQLPREGLIRDSIRFYLGPEWLRENPDFPAPLRDELGFKDFAEVAMGRYGSQRQPLFLIGYPTASVAEIYFARIDNALQGYFSREGVYIKRSGLLISIFPGPEEAATALLDRVHYTADVRWIYDKDKAIDEARERRGEVVTFLGVVTRSIVFTGVFILVVLFCGILAGLLRFWLLKRFPSIRHRDDMVRLGLESRSSETR